MCINTFLATPSCLHCIAQCIMPFAQIAQCAFWGSLIFLAPPLWLCGGEIMAAPSPGSSCGWLQASYLCWVELRKDELDKAHWLSFYSMVIFNFHTGLYGSKSY